MIILGEPWGLLALAGIPAVVALHLWRARHAPQTVSGLFLWPVDRRALATGRRRAPLVLRPSFWCEILLILAATWWLADLHTAARTPARHLVVVLDDRWRMQATAADGSACDTRIRSGVDHLLATLAAGDRATVIASGGPPRLLAGPAAIPATARAALATWRPHSAWHTLDAAVTLATGLAGPGAEILVASDRVPQPLPTGTGVLAAGVPAAASGLADARWWRDSDGERLVAVVQSDHAGSRRLRLTHAGADLAAVDVALDPAKPQLHAFSIPAALPEDAAIELILEGHDPLTIDDHATLLRPPLRRISIRIDLPGAPGAAARAAGIAAGAEVVAATAAADIIVSAPGPRAAVPAEAWRLIIAPGDGVPTIGPFTARRDHPLLGDLDLGDVVWSGSASIARDTTPLLLVGERCLVALERQAGGLDVVLHLDPTRSDLFRRSAWPVLMANLVTWRGARVVGVANPDPRCGQSISAILPMGTVSAVLNGPDGSERTLRADPDGQLTIPGLRLPGAWELHAGSQSWKLSALALDPRQADLAGATTSWSAPIAAGRATIERSRSPLGALLPLLIAALAGFAAWAAYRREERP